jgi:hypothetical protein
MVGHGRCVVNGGGSIRHHRFDFDVMKRSKGKMVRVVIIILKSLLCARVDDGGRRIVKLRLIAFIPVVRVDTCVLPIAIGLGGGRRSTHRGSEGRRGRLFKS